jgi:hypothetical protein
MINHFKIFMALLYLTYLPSLYAMDIFKISYTDDLSKLRAKLVSKIIQKKYFVPSVIIESEYSESCEDIDVDALIHLCINNTGEIKPIYIDYDFFFRSIRVFSKGENL